MDEFRLIVFDWDGTLMDSHARIIASIQQAIESVGAPERTDEQIRSIIGLGLMEAIKVLFPDADKDVHTRMADYYRLGFNKPGPELSTLFDGVPEALEALAAEGFTLAVATSKGRNGIRADLDRSGIADYFSTFRCVDDAPSKPHPEMLQQIMTELDVLPAQTLMVGDTEFDLGMAQRAQAAGVGVSCGAHDPERLQQCQPLTILELASHLPDWLNARRT